MVEGLVKVVMVAMEAMVEALVKVDPSYMLP
jgi:hypothetical protein